MSTFTAEKWFHFFCFSGAIFSNFLKVKKDVVNLLSQLQLSKDAVRTEHLEDSLTEDDLKNIAMEKMETAQETAEDEKASEKLIMAEDCERVTFMSVVKGKLEITTSYVYFFDGSPYKPNKERHDFRYVISDGLWSKFCESSVNLIFWLHR